MANWQVISLDTTTPQLRAPGTGDGYSFNSGSTQLGVWTTTGLGVGTANPQAKLHVAAGNIVIDNNWGIAAFNNAATQESILSITTANNVNVSAPTLSGSLDFNIRNSTGSHRFFIGGTERARIDSSGRLLVGGTSAVVGSANGSIEVQNANTILMGLTSFTAASSGPNLFFCKSRGATVGTNTIVQSGDTVGAFVFRGANGTGYDDAAYIIGSVDGTPGASADMPGRLTFWTSADGSASPTERMRISNAGNVVVNTAAVATTATDGFLYIPTCAGAPTGVPTTFTGRSPLVVDSTNNRFYVYVNGAWKYATLT